MIRRHLGLGLLGLALALPASALEWPWSSAAQGDYSYCKGFTVAALAALPVDRLSRIELWLTWNEIVRSQLEEGGLDPSQYQAGRTRFNELLASGDTSRLRAIAEGDCDLGRH